jgi:L-fuculose-phosphate aldolase
MSLDESSLRDAVVAAVRQLDATGMNRGSTGNVSVRDRDGMLITPTGMGAEDLRPGDVVRLGWDGATEGAWQPSSEWPFHRAIYLARPDLGAVVHAHSIHAAALACLRRRLPPFHYMVAVAGGPDIRCAPYATFGSPELAALAVAAMADRRACLLANHGMIAAGRDLAGALALAIEVEGLAEMYSRAVQIGEPALLSGAEMEVVLGKFRTYGQPDAD